MSPIDVIKWTISTLSAAIALTVGAYNIFDTRAEAVTRHRAIETEIDQASTSIEKRLERIENKLDRMRR